MSDKTYAALVERVKRKINSPAARSSGASAWNSAAGSAFAGVRQAVATLSFM